MSDEPTIEGESPSPPKHIDFGSEAVELTDDELEDFSGGRRVPPPPPAPPPPFI